MASSRSRIRRFQLGPEEIIQILTADDSGDESDIDLDEEDQAFLEQDQDGTGEVIIEEQTPVAGSSTEYKEASETTIPQRKKQKIEERGFQWKKTYCLHEPQSIDYPYRKIKLIFDVNQTVSPMEVFQKTCNLDQFISDIVSQSELYMQQKGITFSTNAEEVKAFIGMVFVMGYHVLPSIRDYWSTMPCTRVPFIANVMPRVRFERIWSALHFANNELLDKSDPTYDRAFKIRPILNHFNESFQAAREPSKQQSIDEHMIKFKGHNMMKQYIKSKPIKWGFKMWCRCDSTTGYLYECDLYTGKKTNVEYGLGEGVVQMLTTSLKDLYCEVYIDNFFNSPSLQESLLHKGIYSCGTVRSNRKFMPKSLKNDKCMKRGDIDYVSANKVNCVKWMDNRSVLMLSNFISPEEKTTARRRQQGNVEKLVIDCPMMIKKYNQFMGGVDLMDQLKGTYGYDRKSPTKFYLRVFFDVLDISLNNAYCIYKELLEKNEPATKPMTRLDYRRVIARTLIGKYSNRERTASTSSSGKASVDAAPTPEHKLQKTAIRRRCVQCAKSKLQGRTNNICSTCQVYLCYTTDRNCFAAYHNM
jgi:hypothetical protein